MLSLWIIKVCMYVSGNAIYMLSLCLIKVCMYVSGNAIYMLSLWIIKVCVYVSGNAECEWCGPTPGRCDGSHVPPGSQTDEHHANQL